ncbi:MAG: 5-(carboxyamino)imidazole ribonucleotide synthase [Alphaproteobacteria bacterium]|nr:5-(carboxyamino)imidazole ribonucleotide synthase [Alphaproteobacteria bacterium]MCB9929243.1 5-(carboxyamino)imidazole ribonucleotide synthase [Alphaproteobacteria bacterium]
MIAPGATIGVLGGGQLGRMFALAAARLGYRVHVFAPEADNPTEQVCAAATHAGYDDTAALKAFAAACDVVTYEFENVPVDAAETIAATTPVRPAPDWLRVAQDRRREKAFVQAAGAEVAAYKAIATAADLTQPGLSFPGILKTAQSGYDGKGQVRVADASDLPAAWESLGRVPCVLEAVVPFERELSVIVARGADGRVQCFPPVENRHENHILAETIAPAPVADSVAAKAVALAESIARHGDLVGLVAVEMFLLPDGGLLVNELAPRPHNSGHWSMDACQTDQFEQCVRAVCGLPLGGTAVLAPARMRNLLGDAVDDWARYLADPTAHLHLYGKGEARPGRKMGHVNFVDLPRR